MAAGIDRQWRTKEISRPVNLEEAPYKGVAEVMGPALQAVSEAQGTSIKEAIRLVAKQADVSPLTVAQLRTGARQPSSQNHGCARPVAEAVRRLTGGEHVLVFPARTQPNTRAAYAKSIRARRKAVPASPVGKSHVFPGATGCRVELTATGVTVTLF